VVLLEQTDLQTGRPVVIGRGPKVASLLEPGRTKPYQFSAAIDTADWCVCVVQAQNFSALDADPQCVNLFERDTVASDDLLARTPRQEGWSAARVQRLVTLLTARGVSTTGLDATTPLGIWLDRAMATIAPSFTTRTTRIKG